MERVSYQYLHKEHMEWLSEIKFIKEEIQSLRNLCNKKYAHKAVPSKVYFAGLFNQLDHHERLLRNLEIQILSHENFIKEMTEAYSGENFEEGITDHDKNRKHLKTIQKSYKQLKMQLFRALENHK